MRRIMLLNPKGGCGKTTVATSLASYFASRKCPTVIIDHDAQGSSTRWLNVRPEEYPHIHGIPAYRNPKGVTRSWHLRIPAETECVIVDTPAGTKGPDLADLVCKADSILIPVLPSHIDFDAVRGLMDELNALRAVREGDARVGLIANRVRVNTRIYRELDGFARELGTRFITRLRDSQNYIRAAELGLGIYELKGANTRTDRQQWARMLAWLDGKEYSPGIRSAASPVQLNIGLSAQAKG